LLGRAAAGVFGRTQRGIGRGQHVEAHDRARRGGAENRAAGAVDQLVFGAQGQIHRGRHLVGAHQHLALLLLQRHFQFVARFLGLAAIVQPVEQLVAQHLAVALGNGRDLDLVEILGHRIAGVLPVAVKRFETAGGEGECEGDSEQRAAERHGAVIPLPWAGRHVSKNAPAAKRRR
jgi:hypothetical protein